MLLARVYSGEKVARAAAFEHAARGRREATVEAQRAREAR